MRRERAAELIRLARDDIGMTRDELASAAGTTIEAVEDLESGRSTPDAELLDRLMRVAKARPSLPLMVYRADVTAAARRHRLGDVRVFGSTARGTDDEASDIDLLVGTRDDTSLFDLAAFVDDVRDITGFGVDVLTDAQTTDPSFAHVLDEAVPL
jgi:predicted nucleotidyltransferase/DNA-binding XRE family transcriptional regulator